MNTQYKFGRGYWRTIEEGNERLWMIGNGIGGYANGTIIDSNASVFHGYLIASLWNKMKRKYYLVHRLVAEAFIPNPNNYPQVNHKDENPSNNSVDNLEWCTPKYNANYGTRNQRMFNNMPKYCVAKYDLNGNYIAEYLSIKIAARENNISDSNIIKCCKGQRKTAGRYIWKYNDK